MGQFKEFDVALNEYLEHIRADYEKTGHAMNKKFYFQSGTKYIHIIMEDNQRSSHSWIVKKPDNKFKFGDILKSATWKAPARNFARGNILTGDFKNVRWVGA